MSVSRSVIVTCAITGSIHTPSQSPYLPLTPAQIIDESVAAAKAGASVLHLHARNPADGSPTADPEIFMQFLPQIRAQCDAIINITTGGGPGMSLEDRLRAPERVSPEMTSLNLGTMNFAGFMALERLPKLEHEWEERYREIARRHVFVNTFEDIDTVMRRLGEGHGVRFEFECYDVGQLYNLAIAFEKRKYDPPLFIQFVLGIPGGIAAELDHLLHLLRTAQRIFGRELEWSVLAAGRHQMAMCTHAALMGGNVRVGLEDSLYIGPGQLARTNAEQVQKICRILKEHSLQPATVAETRTRLGLKGADKVRL
jgi:uncharacterized protein (DUF849 family)